MDGKSLTVGLLGLLVGGGAGAFALVQTNALHADVDSLRSELRSADQKAGKTREDLQALLTRSTDKWSADVTDVRATVQAARSESELRSKSQDERLGIIDASVAKMGGQLTADVSSMDDRLSALERPNVARKDVEEHPSKYISVTDHREFDPGIVNRYTALSMLSLENKSDADIVWIELKVTYFGADGEIGSKIFSLGDKNTRNPDKAVLPKGRTVKGLAPERNHAGEKVDFSFFSHDTMIPGTATKTEVLIEKVKALE